MDSPFPLICEPWCWKIYLFCSNSCPNKITQFCRSIYHTGAFLRLVDFPVGVHHRKRTKQTSPASSRTPRRNWTLPCSLPWQSSLLSWSSALRTRVVRCETMWGPKKTKSLSWWTEYLLMVRSIINHSYWRYVHQLSYRLGALHFSGFRSTSKSGLASGHDSLRWKTAHL
jgi:hypothetical protein